MYPPYSALWDVVKSRNFSEEARTICKQLTEPYRDFLHGAKHPIHNKVNFKIIPLDISDILSIDCLFIEGVTVYHAYNLFSKFSRIQTFAGSPSGASTIAFLKNLRVNGHLCRQVFTDLGPEFMNRQVWEFFELYHIKHLVCPSQAHWSNGAIERRNRTIRYVFLKARRIPLFKKLAVHDLLNLVVAAVNESPSRALSGRPPFEVEFAKPILAQEPLLSDFPTDLLPTTLTEQLASRRELRRLVGELTHDAGYRKAMELQLCRKKTTVFETGQLVDFSDERLGMIGPATVVGPVEPGGNRYILNKNGTMFRKQASQMRAHTSMLELDFPACARRALDSDIPSSNSNSSSTRKQKTSSGFYTPSDMSFQGSSLSSFSSTFLAQDVQKDILEHRAGDDEEERKWWEADKSEFDGFIEKDAIEIVRSAPAGSTIVPTMIHRKVKPDKLKSRILGIGTLKHDKREGLTTEVPTVTKELFRLTLTLILTFCWTLGLIDISQAFLQGDEFKTNEPPIYLRPPQNDLGQNLWDKSCLWRLKRPIYGLRDSPYRYWRKLSRLLAAQGFVSHSYDKSFFFLLDSKQKLVGVVCVHIDDILYCGEEQIVKAMSALSMELKFGMWEKDVKATKYLGVQVLREGADSISLEQKEYAETLEEAQGPREFQSKLGQLMWLMQTRPSVCFECSHSGSRATAPTECDVRRLNKSIRDMRANPSGIRLRRLYPKQGLTLHVFTDASLGNLEDLSTQGGVTMFLGQNCTKGVAGTGKIGKVIPREGVASGAVKYERVPANLLYFSSRKLKRVVNSSLSAETVSLLAGFDRAFALRDLLSKFCSVKLVLYTDCGSLVTFLDPNKLVKSSTDTGNKRIQLDIGILREALERGEIDEIRHVDTQHNLADELTKRITKDSELEKAAREAIILVPYVT